MSVSSAQVQVAQTDARGLTEAVAAERLAAQRGEWSASPSRSYASIVRANLLTVFNLILAGFGAVTLIFGDPRDALFLGIIAANAGIGITQEVRAKRALERLSLLVAPQATVVRDGNRRQVALEEVVTGDLIVLGPGDQIPADGPLATAVDLRLDESVLTGESEPTQAQATDHVRSGAYVVEGVATMVASEVGQHSFAAQITGQARSFRHPRSPLERAVNRLLYGLVALVVGLGAALGYSLYHRHVALQTAVSTASAGVVSLIPEGLMVLVSLTYAAAAMRMSRRGVLAQQLNAIESLAAVDTICVDKTGTLTEASLRVVELIAAPATSQERLSRLLSAVAASASVRNRTLEAIADAYPGQAQPLTGEVPFSSRRRWSAAALPEATVYLGAPGRIPAGELADLARARAADGRRVLAVATGADALAAEPELAPSGSLEPIGLVVLSEQLRPNVRDTIAFLRQEGVEIKVLSGDAPQTVAAIARDVGIEVAGVGEGSDLPDGGQALAQFAATTTVIGRISPEGKAAVVAALASQGRYVAMLGDGVNDVPALKASRLAIAQGTGTHMAKAVSDLVLVSGDFATVPTLVSEGRRALRNLQRVTKLYVTKSAFAAFLILTIGVSSDAYPLLPRHLSLAATLTIGIPTFFLALAPSTGAWRPARFVRSVAQFAVPAGTVLGAGVVSGYLFSLHDLDESLGDARNVALITLVTAGLYLVMALEAGGSRRRSTLVASMCAVMAGLFVGALLLPATRSFFALSVPSPGMVITGLLAGAISIGALALCGFTLRVSTEDDGH